MDVLALVVFLAGLWLVKQFDSLRRFSRWVVECDRRWEAEVGHLEDPADDQELVELARLATTALVAHISLHREILEAAVQAKGGSCLFRSLTGRTLLWVTEEDLQAEDGFHLSHRPWGRSETREETVTLGWSNEELARLFFGRDGVRVAPSLLLQEIDAALGCGEAAGYQLLYQFSRRTGEDGQTVMVETLVTRA